VEGLATTVVEDAKRARQTLCDAARRSATNPDDASAAEPEAAAGEEALCDPFAIVALKGRHKGRIIKLQPTAAQHTWTVGRAEGCDICLAGDDEVSSQHAKIHFEKKQFKLMDTGSTNGTFATNNKGCPIKLKSNKNHVLKTDMLMTFGSSTFKWCLFEDAASIAQSTKEM